MATLTLEQRIQKADLALWNLSRDITDAEDDEDYRPLCDCGQWSLDPEDNYEHLCDYCWEACHFSCDGCFEEHHVDDRDPEFPEYCLDCAAEHRAEVIDGYKTELDEILADWMGEPGEIERLKKLVAYAKRLK